MGLRFPTVRWCCTVGGHKGGDSTRDPGDAGEGGGGGQTGSGHETHFRQWIGAGGSYGGSGSGYARDGRSVDPGPVYGDRKISALLGGSGGSGAQ